MNYVDLANKLTRIRIRHRLYEQTYRLAYANLQIANGGDVIFLVGPSRVGKSTLLAECIHDMFKGHHDERYIPYACVDASQTNQGSISLKQLWADFLAVLKHPAFTDSSYLPRHSHTEAALRSIIARTLQARRTALLAVDEAMPIFSSRSRGGPLAALDTLKCLGNETNVAIVICGDYTMLDRCFLSAHLNGRMVVLEFPGYSTNKADSADFNRILTSIDSLLPWKSGQCLMIYRDLVYAGTAGCVGSIIKWAKLALAQMGAHERHRLTIADFESSRRVAQAESFHDLNQRRHLLKKMRTGMFESASPLPEEEAARNTAPPGRRRPGQRSLTRDSVGVTPA